jgi:hypothetical protein
LLAHPTVPFVRRRKFLSLTGVGLVTALAGCGGTGGGGGGGDGGGDGAGNGGDGSGGGTGGGTTETLSFGESFENPVGVVTTVHGIELQDNLEYESQYGGTVTQTPDDGMQWAVVDIGAANRSDSDASLPPSMVYELAAGETTHGNVSVDAAGDAGYTAGEVPPGDSSRGRLLYAIPAEFAVGDGSAGLQQRDARRRVDGWVGSRLTRGQIFGPSPPGPPGGQRPRDGGRGGPSHDRRDRPGRNNQPLYASDSKLQTLGESTWPIHGSPSGRWRSWQSSFRCR